MSAVSPVSGGVVSLQVETEVFDKMDDLIASGRGDEEYRELFKDMSVDQTSNQVLLFIKELFSLQTPPTLCLQESWLFWGDLYQLCESSDWSATGLPQCVQ